MILTKTAERISFFGFYTVLFISSIPTVIMFLSFQFSFFVNDLLPLSIASIPLLWFMTIIFLSNSFRFANLKNQNSLDIFVRSGTYYLMVFFTLGLLPTYVLYAYLMCNQRRTGMFSIEVLNKIIGLVPILNFIVMFNVAKTKISFREATKLFFAFSLARHIYLNFKASYDIFN
jgi:hypothetical protein